MGTIAYQGGEGGRKMEGKKEGEGEKGGEGRGFDSQISQLRLGKYNVEWMKDSKDVCFCASPN